MHFRTLLFVELPEIKQDPEWEKKVMDQMDEIKAKHPGKVIENALTGFYLGKLTNIQTAFGYALDQVIGDAMERFYCNTEDPKYLTFEDRTEEYLADYNKDVDCVVMPGGKIQEINSYPIWGRFIIQDGLVFQKKAGKLKHPKRTKKAKKMKALPGYPRKKLYSSFKEYVEEEAGGRLNESTGQYGEWYNPDGVYDWYSIGGRWPEMFLVKLDCTEYSYGERSYMDDGFHPAPEGFRWVACARKKDIQWDAMRDWRNQQARDRFNELEAMFRAGKIDETAHRITEEGIFAWGEQIYRNGQTLDEFMSKYGIPENWKYPISVCGIFNDECYLSDTDCVYDEGTQKWRSVEWRETLENYIDDADDDTVLVGIDYHM